MVKTQRITLQEMKDAIGKYHGFGDHAHRAEQKAEKLHNAGYEFYVTNIGIFMLSHEKSAVMLKSEVYPAKLLLPEEYTE